MPKFGEHSKKALETAHPKLRELFEEVVKYYDCQVRDGFRNEEDQERAFRDGFSKVRWPNSKHNTYPSLAVDVVPYPVDWKDEKRFYILAGCVQTVAYRLGINIRWGGDFNKDGKLNNDPWIDLPHYELIQDVAGPGNPANA